MPSQTVRNLPVIMTQPDDSDAVTTVYEIRLAVGGNHTRIPAEVVESLDQMREYGGAVIVRQGLWPVGFDYWNNQELLDVSWP